MLGPTLLVAPASLAANNNEEHVTCNGMAQYVHHAEQLS